MTRSQKRIENRRKILVAAAAVFEREGLIQASMRKIAREADCTTGAIYLHFDNKEALYVALLEESLDRLYTAVSEAAAPELDDLDALVAAVSAFYHYYVSNTFEANLGMYIYGMGQIRGMGAEPDNLLNQKLLQTVDIFAACLQSLTPEQITESKGRDWVVAERDLIFSMLMGLLTMQRSGRAKSIGTTSATLFTNYITRLRERYEK